MEETLFEPVGPMIVKQIQSAVVRYQAVVIETDRILKPEDQHHLSKMVAEGLENGLVFLPPGFSIKTVDRDRIVELR